MSCPKPLRDAIEGLYVAFAEYPLPDNTMPCPCCHPPGADAPLHAEPLRQLQWEHLADYSIDALMVWGDLNCYKHFLPRIFELVLTAGEWPETPDPEMVFNKLGYGHWRTWPPHEQKAIEQMLHTVWETLRSNSPMQSDYFDIDQWLCCISQCEEDLAPYLDLWMKDESLSAAWALSSLILSSAIAYTDADASRDRNAFWQYCEFQYAQLQRWVKSAGVLEKLHRAEINWEATEMAYEFQTAQQCIREAETTNFEVLYKSRRFQSAECPTYRLY